MFYKIYRYKDKEFVFAAMKGWLKYSSQYDIIKNEQPLEKVVYVLHDIGGEEDTFFEEVHREECKRRLCETLDVQGYEPYWYDNLKMMEPKFDERVLKACRAYKAPAVNIEQPVEVG